MAAADAERRRVERDLHDGAQQHLVALAVNVRLVRDLVTEDPDAAAEALDEIAGEVKATVQELRDLAHGIYPPLLMDNGLPEALRAVASRSPLDVATAVEGIGRFSPGYRGGGLLLLPRGPAERGQARPRVTSGGAGVGGGGRAPLHGLRRRPGIRRRGWRRPATAS